MEAYVIQIKYLIPINDERNLNMYYHKFNDYSVATLSKNLVLMKLMAKFL